VLLVSFVVKSFNKRLESFAHRFMHLTDHTGGGRKHPAVARKKIPAGNGQQSRKDCSWRAAGTLESFLGFSTFCLNQEFDDEPAFIVELAKEEKRNVRAALISPF